MLRHASAGELPLRAITALSRLAQTVRLGKPIPHYGPTGTLTMTRTQDGQVVLHRGPLPKGGFVAAPSVTAPSRIELEGPALWKELEAGADTPDERWRLAFGMLQKLPCGECKTHWQKALTERPPDVETAEAFRRWVWSEHNLINARKGKPELPWESYAQKKK